MSSGFLFEQNSDIPQAACGAADSGAEHPCDLPEFIVEYDMPQYEGPLFNEETDPILNWLRDPCNQSQSTGVPALNSIPMNSQFSQGTEDYSDESTMDDPPHVITDEQDPSIMLTDLSSMREVIATRVGHSGGQLSKTLEDYPGFIAIPLRAMTMLRYPDTRHKYNGKVFIWCPLNEHEMGFAQTYYPQFIELAKTLNS